MHTSTDTGLLKDIRANQIPSDYVVGHWFVQSFTYWTCLQIAMQYDKTSFIFVVLAKMCAVIN